MPGVARGDVAALARLLVGTKVGLFSRLQVLPHHAGDIPLAHVTAAVPHYERLTGGGDIPGGGASHADVSGSAARALMESIERYCAAFVDVHRLVLSKPMPHGPFLFGAALPLYAPWQYERPGWPYRPLTLDSEIRWVDGRSLITGRRWLVPAGLVHVPYDYSAEAERLGPSTSTGMACAWSQTEAALTGLLEVCERDAFAIAWLNRLSMPRLRVPPDSALGKKVERLRADSPARVTFVNLTNDLRVPVVMAVQDKPWGSQRLVTVGLAARPTLEQAAEKAFLEAASEYCRLRDELAKPGPRWQPAPEWRNVSDYPWHSLVYADPALQGELEFLVASPVEQTLDQEVNQHGSPSELLLLYSQLLARLDMDAIVVSLTTRDVACLGVHVVKVMVPRAVPLNPHHLAPWLGHSRVYRVPRLLGYRETDSTPDELNLAYPHPFA